MKREGSKLRLVVDEYVRIADPPRHTLLDVEAFIVTLSHNASPILFKTELNLEFDRRVIALWNAVVEGTNELTELGEELFTDLQKWVDEHQKQ